MKYKNTAWTSAEEAALARALKDNVSAARLSVRLQRSEGSIKRRIRELGLAEKSRKEDVPQVGIDPVLEVRKWLDTCKSGDLASLMAFYDTEATLECACSGPAIYAGLAAIQEYWAPKLRSTTPNRFSLISARTEDERVVVNYLGFAAKPVRMHFSFNLVGKIEHSECGPLDCEKLAA